MMMDKVQDKIYGEYFIFLLMQATWSSVCVFKNVFIVNIDTRGLRGEGITSWPL